MQRSALIAGIVLCCVTVCCSVSHSKFISSSTVNVSAAPDYRDLQYWAAHPDKKDIADSIPKPLQTSLPPDTAVAVFFVHPTTLTSGRDTSWNASLGNDTINRKTDNTTILYQSTAFNAYQLYAPRYRQAHLRAYYTKDTLNARKAFDLAYEDIKAAFFQFLEWNPSRPIVIASHSQGSTHAIRLLNEYFQNGELKSRLVVAYILGMHIPTLGVLNLCVDSVQSGCVCAWRTFKSGYVPSYIKLESGPAFVTNPLTWDTTAAFAPRHLNKGAIVRDFNKIYPAAADAQIHERVLWVDKLRFPGQILLRTNNYHAGDINLFYVNIRQNLHTRIRAFLSK
jgi:hypothetical protein